MTVEFPPYTLSYGSLEGILSGLADASSDAIRSRFRKLRLRPFPDDIQTGTGVRVHYDLPRILAIAAVFELNRLQLPQGHAVAMVEATWPEWCRAVVASAVASLGLPRPRLMPAEAGSLVVLRPDAFAAAPGSWIDAQVRSEMPQDAVAGGGAIVVDAGRILAALADATVSRQAAGTIERALAKLDRTFGWTMDPLRPSAAVSEMPRGLSFLDEGPYFPRAAALLGAPDAMFDPARHPAAASRLQSLVAYLERPAPIDAWKGDVGDDAGEVRLKHLIYAFASERKLHTTERYGDTVATAGGDEVRQRALSFVQSAASLGGR